MEELGKNVSVAFNDMFFNVQKREDNNEDVSLYSLKCICTEDIIINAITARRPLVQASLVK